MTATLDPMVRASWAAAMTPLEGCVPWLYCDVRGLVTTGIGNLIDPIGAALPLPWLDASGSPASLAAVRDEWTRVKSLGGGLEFHHYRGELHLDDAAIAELVGSRLDADVTILLHAFPAFASFPAPAQAAICSMAWAMGAGFPASWPRLSGFVSNRDWTGAAGDCAINAVGNPGVVPRNLVQRALFLSAADPSLTLADAAKAAGIVAGPTGEAAMAALRAL